VNNNPVVNLSLDNIDVLTPDGAAVSEVRSAVRQMFLGKDKTCSKILLGNGGAPRNITTADEMSAQQFEGPVALTLHDPPVDAIPQPPVRQCFKDLQAATKFFLKKEIYSQSSRELSPPAGGHLSETANRKK
jgi:hypothetical protein